MGSYIDSYIIIIIVMLSLYDIPLFLCFLEERGMWILTYMYILSTYSPLFDSGRTWYDVMTFSIYFWILDCGLY